MKTLIQKCSLVFCIMATLGLTLGWKKSTLELSPNDSTKFRRHVKMNQSSKPVTRQLISDTQMPGTCTGSYIEVAVWGDYTDGTVNNMTTAVDPGFVLIGGGARVTNFSNTDVGVNALLTAASPIDDGTFTTYSGASKDHQQPYNHRLWVYAIGLKISYPCGDGHCLDPVPPATIIRSLNISSITSSPAVSKPNIFVPVPAGYTRLSGGAHINWTGQGNLLVADGFPEFINLVEGVFSSGKDQKVSSPATITGYCLSIKNPIICGENAINLTVKDLTNQVLISQHSQSISQTCDAGYLLSGIGAFSNYNMGSGFGRLLFAMYPQNSTSATASSKDQVNSDISGYLTITITEIKPGF